MLVRAPLAMLGVYERIQVAKLKLDRPPDAVLFAKRRHRLDDGEAVLDTSLMVVGHLENEQVVEVECLRAHRTPLS